MKKLSTLHWGCIIVSDLDSNCISGALLAEQGFLAASSSSPCSPRPEHGKQLEPRTGESHTCIILVVGLCSTLFCLFVLKVHQAKIGSVESVACG